MSSSPRPALQATLPRRPAPIRHAAPPMAAWMRRLGPWLNGPGLLGLPVVVASVVQALSTRGALVPDPALAIASALLAWIPVGACVLAAPLLRDRAMQWRRVALLLALGAGAALVGGVPLVDPSTPAGGGLAGLVSAGVLQAFAGGLLVGAGGWLRRRSHLARVRRAAPGPRA